MFRLEAPDFDLHATLACGQTFCWEPQPDGMWQGWIHDTPCRLRQDGSHLEVHAADAPPPAPEAVRAYLGLDETWDALTTRLPDDPVVQAAAASCRGLRCIRDAPWECTANFICSALKQIPQIRRINHALRRAFAPDPSAPPWPSAPFPTPEQIAASPEALLRKAGLGFRARHLHRAAQHIVRHGFPFETVFALELPDAVARLRLLPGVGDKVAHCILLYAARRYDAFPLDVWMIRLLRQHYRRPGRRLARPADLHRFATRHLGSHRGLAQIYLFHDGRTRANSAPRKRMRP